MTSPSNVLMLYIEPTPYILGLIERVREKFDGGVHVVFIASEVSQPWGLEVSCDSTEILPESRALAMRRIDALLSSGRFGVVHLAGWGGRVLLSTIIAARMRNIPCVVESDTPRSPCIPRWKHAIKAITYPTLFRLPAMFLPGGTRQAQYLKDFGVSEGKITVAGMTVDTTQITSFVDGLTDVDRNRVRQRLGIPTDAIVFLYVGRMEQHKGVHILLLAFERLKQANPNVCLLLVGGGTLTEELEQRARQGEGVVMTGRQSGDAVWECYRASDVFVLPSLFEPWGLVVNEALAAGLPVIATDRVGCVDDLVLEGESGVVIPADDAEALESAMAKLAGDASLRLKLSTGGRAIIRHWTLEEEAAKVLEVWRTVASKGKA